MLLMPMVTRMEQVPDIDPLPYIKGKRVNGRF